MKSLLPTLATLLLLFTSGCRPSLHVRAPVEYEVLKRQTIDTRAKRWAELIRDAEKGSRLAPPIPQSLSEWTRVVSFLHVSDVQIRDSQLLFMGEVPSRIADMIVTGVERPPALDRNDEAPFAALVAATNNLEEANRFNFLIHTGDAIDVGTTGELLTFLSIANRLKIPWLACVGNHDAYYFGNYTKRGIERTGDLDKVKWVVDKRRFMRLHGRQESGSALYPPPVTGKPNYFSHHLYTEQGGVVPPSYFHGFDLGDGNRSNDLRTYYTFLINSGQKIKVRVIVLDTTVSEESLRVGPFDGDGVPVGYRGHVDAEQFRWLQGLLEEAEADDEWLLVFGHHSLTGARREPPLVTRDPTSSSRDLLELKQLLLPSPRVLAYFCGHSHEPRVLKLLKISEGNYRDLPLLEVMAPSLHEAPQFAFGVWLLQKDGDLRLQVAPLQGRLRGEALLRNRVDQAIAGAGQDKDNTSIQQKHFNATNGNIIVTPEIQVESPGCLVGRSTGAPRQQPTAGSQDVPPSDRSSWGGFWDRFKWASSPLDRTSPPHGSRLPKNRPRRR